MINLRARERASELEKKQKKSNSLQFCHHFSTPKIFYFKWDEIYKLMIRHAIKLLPTRFNFTLVEEILRKKKRREKKLGSERQKLREITLRNWNAREKGKKNLIKCIMLYFYSLECWESKFSIDSSFSLNQNQLFIEIFKWIRIYENCESIENEQIAFLFFSLIFRSYFKWNIYIYILNLIMNLMKMSQSIYT